MKAISKILATGVGIAALAGAAPAAAQYYPGTGYGYGGGDILSQIINSVLGGQRYGQYGYGYNPQQQRYLVEQCARQTEYRIQRQYSGYNANYGGAYGGYGYNNVGASPARIVSITRVEPRSNGGVKIWGTATSGRYGNYGSAYGGAYGGYNGYGGYGQQSPYGASQYGYNTSAMADLHFDCTIDYRGRVIDIDVDRNSNSYRGY